MFRRAGPSGFRGPSDLCVSSVKPSVMSLGEAEGTAGASPGLGVGPRNCWDSCVGRKTALFGAAQQQSRSSIQPQAVIWDFEVEFEERQDQWKPWCCSGNRMLDGSVRDSPARKTHWSPAAHSWGCSSLSVFLLVLFVLPEMKKLLLCLVTVRAGSGLPAQPESGGDPCVAVTALGQHCQNQGTHPRPWLVTSDHPHHYIQCWTTSSWPWITPGKVPFNKSSFSKAFFLEKFSSSHLIQSLLALYLQMALDWTLKNAFSAEPAASKLILMLCFFCARQVGSFPAHWDRKAVISIKISDLTFTFVKSWRSLAHCHRWTDALFLPDKFVWISCLHIII